MLNVGPAGAATVVAAGAGAAVPAAGGLLAGAAVSASLCWLHAVPARATPSASASGFRYCFVMEFPLSW